MLNFLKKIPSVTLSLLEAAAGALAGALVALWRHNAEYADERMEAEHAQLNGSLHQAPEVPPASPTDMTVYALAGVGMIYCAKAAFTGTRSLREMVQRNTTHKTAATTELSGGSTERKPHLH